MVIVLWGKHTAFPKQHINDIDLHDKHNQQPADKILASAGDVFALGFRR
jgi:hypothetical protein